MEKKIQGERESVWRRKYKERERERECKKEILIEEKRERERERERERMKHFNKRFYCHSFLLLSSIHLKRKNVFIYLFLGGLIL